MTSNDIVLMSDPKVPAIPVQECSEALVDVRDHGPRVDDRRSDDTGALARLREGVLIRLPHAQELLPDGLRLLFVEGYRPPSLQRTSFEAYRDELAPTVPRRPKARLREAADRFVPSPQIAPHSAGAAVDLTLIDADGP